MYENFSSFGLSPFCSRSHDAVVDFNRLNGITSIVRGHEAQQEGYNLYSADFKTKFPDLITIFSAPNYCGYYRNKAAILEYHDDIKIRQFNWVEHPYWLPQFRNAFEWSAPFIVEKVRSNELCCRRVAYIHFE